MRDDAHPAPGGSRRLLMVEDETIIAAPLVQGLEEEGYRVDLAADGVEGERMALSEEFDVLVVDWRLPRMDGRTLVRRLRGAGLTMPILMLTAMRDVDHRVAGLDAGADDYLTKPFSFEELLARLRALVRRLPAAAPGPGFQSIHLRLGLLEVDAARRLATFAGTPLDLRPKEFQFVELLLRHPQEVVTRSMIAERVWGSLFDVTDNAIDITVSNVRQRLAEVAGGNGVAVETVRGVGYRLVLTNE